jgi:hypothetical protein
MGSIYGELLNRRIVENELEAFIVVGGDLGIPILIHSP